MRSLLLSSLLALALLPATPPLQIATNYLLFSGNDSFSVRRALFDLK